MGTKPQQMLQMLASPADTLLFTAGTKIDSLLFRFCTALCQMMHTF